MICVDWGDSDQLLFLGSDSDGVAGCCPVQVVQHGSGEGRR